MFYLLAFNMASAQLPIIDKLLPMVSTDTLLRHIRLLSGADSLELNGNKVLLSSRHRLMPGNEWAERYLSNKLSEYGYQVETQPFDSRGKNLIAIKRGNLFPQQAWIICAHYDAIAFPHTVAPGADDNASGCAAVLEAARLLKDESLPFTVVFIFFDEEEQGLVGSIRYNEVHDNADYEILGAINIDMIGYDANDDGAMEIHSQPFNRSPQLAYQPIRINDEQNLGLQPKLIAEGTSASDHGAFWSKGRSAILLIESDDEFNPAYHSAGDTVGLINPNYLTQNARLALGTLLWVAGNTTDVVSTAIPSPPKSSLYPNPSNGLYYLNSTINSEYQVYDLHGKLVLLGQLIKGVNQISLNYQPNGIYWFKIKDHNQQISPQIMIKYE